MIKQYPMAFGILLTLGGLFVLYTWWGDRSGFGIFGFVIGLFSLGVGLWNIVEAQKKET